MSCHMVTRELWLSAISRNIHLSAEHVPGSENLLADRASRIFDENTEWQLGITVVSELARNFGPFDIDLLASRLNSQCENIDIKNIDIYGEKFYP